MKRLVSSLLFAALAGIVVLAHGGNEHVRGVVTAISAQSVTVQTADKAAKTLTLTAKTAIKVAGKVAHAADIKVGDRVVVDVPEHTTEAVLIQVGAAPPAKAAPTTAKAH